MAAWQQILTTTSGALSSDLNNYLLKTGGTLSGDLTISKAADVNANFTATSGDSNINIKLTPNGGGDAYIKTAMDSNTSLVFTKSTSNEVAVLTLDNSSNATFAGNVTLPNSSTLTMGGNSKIISTGVDRTYLEWDDFDLTFIQHYLGNYFNTISFGLGNANQQTLSTNLDNDDIVIKRDIDGASTYSETGTLLRLEKDVTNVTSESGNYLEWVDTTGGVLGVINASGNVGIGIVDPDQALEVGNAGKIKVSGTTAEYSARTLILESNMWQKITASNDFDILYGGYLNIGGDVRVLSNGKVGIGYTDPVTKLEVADGLAVTSVSAGGAPRFWLYDYANDNESANIQFHKSKSGTRGTHAVVVDGTDLGRIAFYASDGNSWEASAEIKAEIDGTPGNSDVPGRLTFATASDGSGTTTERMRIDSRGYVGIGTSPYNKFHVLDGTLPQVRIQNDDAGEAVGIRLKSRSSGDSHEFHADIIGIQTANTTDVGYIGFKVPYNAAPRMAILSTGNVGIGTTSPVSTLHVEGVSTTTSGDSNAGITLKAGGEKILQGWNEGHVNIGEGTFTTAYKVMIHGNTAVQGNLFIPNANYIGFGNGTSRIDGTGDAGYLSFLTNTTERMRIVNGGNVGIGCTDPEQPLDVKGSVRIRSTSSNEDRFLFNPSNAGGDAILKMYNNAQTDNVHIDAGSGKLYYTGGRLIIGHTSAVSAINTLNFQVNATDNSHGVSINNWGTNGANQGFLYFNHSKSGTAGSHTVLANNDAIGAIYWQGSDGNDFANSSARIVANVDGTPASNRVPGEIVFETAAGAADNDILPKMIIRADGKVGIGVTTNEAFAGDYTGKTSQVQIGGSAYGNTKGLKIGGSGVDIPILENFGITTALFYKQSLVIQVHILSPILVIMHQLQHFDFTFKALSVLLYIIMAMSALATLLQVIS